MPDRYRTPAETAALHEHVQVMAQTSRAGVFRRSDLPGWGVDDRIIPVMLRHGWWVRLHHGVYVARSTLEAATAPQDLHLIHAAAALAAIPGPASLFAASAAVVHRLAFDRAVLGPVHLVRPVGRDSRALRRRLTASDRLDPAVVHQHAFSPEDVCAVQGLSVVSVPLTAVSTAALSDPEWAVVTMDAACWQSPDTLARVAELTDEWSRLLGIGTVRRALPLVRTGAQTPLETLSRIRLMRCGLPEPQLQTPLHDSSGLIGYVDMLWDQLGVVGEADGALKYSSGQVLLDEKAREDRIRALGFIVVRWTWDEILRHPARVAARIEAASAIQRRHAR